MFQLLKVWQCQSQLNSDKFWSLIFTLIFSYRDLIYAGIYYIFPSKGTEEKRPYHKHIMEGSLSNLKRSLQVL